MSFCERKTQEAVNAEWNSMAGEWDDVASEYCDQFHKILWEETTLNPNQALRILDFGCGTGLLTERLLESSPESKIVCIDAAEDMIMQVQQKMQAREWKNVEAYLATLGRYNEMETDLREKIDSLVGTFDLIVASSVINFIPPQDLAVTIQALGKLLKPGGIFCHSDWPDSKLFPGGITLEKAENLYREGKFKMKSHALRPVKIEGEEGIVFVGIAEKDQVQH
jgi:2-polyprenyl-3-methyl-5-hydroxy-6-metoxy-1,4-benzoquinol methylase